MSRKECGDGCEQRARGEGDTSTGCENRITGALAGVAGVESASADHEEGRVLVNLEPSVVSEAEMRDAIEGLGYRVVS